MIPMALAAFQNGCTKTTKIIPVDVEMPETECAIYLKKTLYPAFFFAEKHCLVDFQNAVVDAIQIIHFREETIPDTEDISIIHQNTHPGSKLRLFCVALVAWAICDETFSPEGREINKDQIHEFVELSQTINGLAFDLLCFQASYGDAFYETPRRDPRSSREYGFGGDFQEGLGRKFFHSAADGGSKKNKQTQQSSSAVGTDLDAGPSLDS
jgi:hypothetical protein